MKKIFFSLVTAGLVSGCATTDSGVTDAGPRGGDYPYGLKVRDKKGFVVSPYNKTGAIIDVRDFPKGTQVDDPWTGKIFLVP